MPAFQRLSTAHQDFSVVCGILHVQKDGEGGVVLPQSDEVQPAVLHVQVEEAAVSYTLLINEPLNLPRSEPWLT